MEHDINQLVLEDLAGAGLGLLGRGLANIGTNMVTNLAGGAGLSTMSPLLTGAHSAAAPTVLANAGYSTLGSIPLGQIVTGGLGVYQQHQLNKLKDQYNQLMGIQEKPDTFWNVAKMAGTGLVSSIPFVGGLMNMYKGSQIEDMKNKIRSMQAYDGYMNRMNGNPPQIQQPAPSQPPMQQPMEQ